VRRLLPLAALLLLPARAAAHPFDLASLELTSQQDVVQARLECALPVALEAARLPEGTDLSPAGVSRTLPALFAATLGSGALTVDGRPCRWGSPEGSVEGIRIQLRVAARCDAAPGALKLTLPFVDERPPTFRILGVATLGGQHLEFQAGPGRQTVALQGPPASARESLVRGLELPRRSPFARLALLLLLALPLGASRRDGLLGLGAAVIGLSVGVALGHDGVSIAATLLRVAAGLAVGAGLLEPLLRRVAWGRWRLGLLAGAVIGLGLGATSAASMALAGLAVELGIAGALAVVGAARLRVGGRIAQVAAVVLGVGVVVAAALP
jgi:hypothetical protein